MRFKARLNLVIDIVMMLCMAAVAGIGFLMKSVLITSRERLVVYRRSVELKWLGLGRHDWGAVHLYISFLLLALLALHIIFHWSMIVNLYRRLIRGAALRVVLAIVFVIVCLVLVAFPLLVKPEVLEGGPGHGGGGGYRGGRFGDRSAGSPPASTVLQ